MLFVFLLNKEKVVVVLKDRQDGYGDVLVAYKNDFIRTLRMDLDSNCAIGLTSDITGWM